MRIYCHGHVMPDAQPSCARAMQYIRLNAIPISCRGQYPLLRLAVNLCPARCLSIGAGVAEAADDLLTLCCAHVQPWQATARQNTPKHIGQRHIKMIWQHFVAYNAPSPCLLFPFPNLPSSWLAPSRRASYFAKIWEGEKQGAARARPRGPILAIYKIKNKILKFRQHFPFSEADNIRTNPWRSQVALSFPNGKLQNLLRCSWGVMNPWGFLKLWAR